MSLRRRLSIALSAVAALSVLFTALVAIGLVRRFAETSALSELKRLGQAVALEVGAGRLLAEREFGPTQRILLISGAQLAVVRPDGGIDGDAAPIVDSIADAELLLQGAEIEGTVAHDGRSYAYVGFPIVARRFAHGVILVRPIGLAETIGGPILARIILAAGAAVVVAILISTFLARRLSEPLHELSEATEQVASGELAHRVKVSSDDEIGKLGESFNEMAAALEEAKRRESEFLQSVSHELRTPITAIKGYVEALEEGAVKDQKGRKHALSVIRSETERVERLIEDVTDLARLGSREFRLDVHRVDLASTLQSAADAHSEDARSSRVGLEVEVEGNLEAETDEGRVRQVVSNLLSNALKVTPSGGRVRLFGKASDGSVVISVSDTGPGIPAEHLDHVFERSYLRVGGLGLAIVRELISTLGGEVEVQSDQGKGTTFIVTVPNHTA